MGRTLSTKERSTLVSSGRQMPTKEQRVHLGLSSSGGGIRPPSTTSRRTAKDSRVSARSSSSNGTRTRSREPAKYSTPAEHL